MRNFTLNIPTTTKLREAEIRAELAAVGLVWRDAKRLAPDWFGSALESGSGFLEAKLFLAKNFGLRLDQNGKLQRSSAVPTKFKTRANIDISEVVSAQHMAASCARTVASSFDTPVSAFGLLPDALRSKAFNLTNRPWFDFEVLVNLSWSLGVPVLYLPNIPAAGKKMDGLVTFVLGRPVVVLTRKSHPDWLLFILAHELGHIAMGHLEASEGASILDEKISDDADYDVQEKEANEFAVSVLTPGGRKLRLQQLMSANKFSQLALSYGREHGISPGHVILNASKHKTVNGKSIWPLGIKALGMLPDDARSRPAEIVCKEATNKYLDLSKISDDSLEFLEKLDVI